MRVLAAIAAVSLLACAGPPEFVKEAPLLEGMGDTHLGVTTESELAQRYFDQGLVLAYGFNHAEAGRSFREARRLDPGLAMGYWGEALVLGPNINATMDDADAPRAYEAAQLAVQHAEGATPLERALIEALTARYAPEPVEDRAPLDIAYANAMHGVAQAYPDDPHAQALYAEALMDTMPWDYWQPDGTPKPALDRVLAALERAIELDADHPGANHLWIHAVEAVRPADGEAAADRLGALVPGAGHLVHMPSHIYIRVGRYADASEANERAIASDDDYVAQCHAQGLYPLAYVPHNHHFLWYAAAMEGRSERALQAAYHVRASVDPEIMRQPGFGTLQHFYSLPLFTLVRFGRWDAILEEPSPDPDLVYPLGVWHYARGMSLLQGEQIVLAEQHAEILGVLLDDPRLDGVTIWDINDTRHILQLASSSLAAELAVKRGDTAAALARLREAVVLEDSLRYDEPPPWHSPVRQRLGDLLLILGRADEAEAAYREDLQKYPENGWSLAGLARSLEAQGRRRESTEVRKRFERAWARADIELYTGAF
jgi:tetratricopeptide (TPR) repeat protein